MTESTVTKREIMKQWKRMGNNKRKTCKSY